MIAGVSGDLISGAFLESRANQDAAPQPSTAAIGLALKRAAASCGPASALRALLHAGALPLLAALGFNRIVDTHESGAGMATLLESDAARVVLLVVPFGARLDPCWRHAVVAARQAGAEWALLYNGCCLRLVDATHLHARRHLEFDLDAATLPTAINALWLTVSAEALRGGDAAALRSLLSASQEHASAVCRSLRDGVLGASAQLLEALVERGPRRRPVPISDSFEQALTIVYRLLFLLFAEARALVPLWHPVYRESYSVEALRAAAERSVHVRGMWDAVRAMSRLAHAGCRAGDLRVTPFNGRLFAPARTPLAERRNLDDEKARRAVLALSTRANAASGSRERISYRDLGVEQLGAVYETLLDYEPHRTERGRIELRAESTLRKTTGTFYTPQQVADYLVRRTLAPLVRGRSAAEILQLRIVDPSMGSGAFLVAACRYLAEAYEAAAIAAGDFEEKDIADADRALFRRRIAERCVYGVDVNPMAVQLARLSLWLATLAADRPLSFLDHRLMVGDSLVGAALANLRLAPRRRARASQRAPTLFDDDAIAGAVRDTLPVRFSLESTPNDTVAQVRAKEAAHAAALGRNAALWRWKRIADAWCASWFGPVPPAAFGAMTDFFLHGSGALPRKTLDAYLAACEYAASRHAFFHWELECPEVFFDDNGSRRANAGFDAVVGNPPWNIVHAVDAALLRFARHSGVYHVRGDGHANRYQLFVERAVALTKAGGRIGLVLPWGFAADQGSGALRTFVLHRTAVEALVAIDNHRGVFPIHRSVRFVLVNATAGGSTEAVDCTFGVEDPAALESIGEETPESPKTIRLSSAALERLSGPAMAIPYAKTPVDLAIAERAASLFQPLGSAAGWRASFGRELNATEDRALFQPGGRGWPVVEGKHLAPFRIDATATRYSVAPADARRALGPRRCEMPRLAYRDVAGATNRVTLIAAMLPPRCVSTHTVFCLQTPLAPRDQQFLCGLFNSLVVNFLVRMRVTTHVTTAIVERLPIPAWHDAPAAAREIAALARLMRRTTHREGLARLNALVARLYQLTDDEFRRVLETFPLIERAERARALDAFVRMPRR